ncbi:(d)CMP kinase [Amycolatopsis nigrescens]|uniref:(d)CMP kinase n=1 Tax=Amycolatopsis nigrescens TaxID=381445 RepID=UPI000380F865|nr:(d)CMP kinase [Amycolatopsis nigrescens]
MVAMDGPSGTGKTTVARKLAERLSAGYLDTGSMYRVVTLAVLRAGIDPADAAAVAALARGVTVEVGTGPDRPGAALDGADVSAAIRGDDVNHAVSPVSAVPEVRELLVAQQRRIIDQVLAEVGGIVVEGRDIGTVVAPDAPLKIFLTASAEVRAARRGAQDSTAGRTAAPEDVRAAVDRRDRLDSSRAVSPLRAAEDAVRVDTSELKIDQVLVALCELASQRGMLSGCVQPVGSEARP